MLDSKQAAWARLFTGGDPWRNAAAARCELGWWTSGAAQAGREAARKRARLWDLADTDYVKQAFIHGHSSASSWATRSYELLLRFDIDDFIAGDGVIQEYFRYVDKHLAALCYRQWFSEVSRHVSPVRYTQLFPSNGHTPAKQLQLQLSWLTLVNYRSLCKLRSSLLKLGHNNGRSSQARHQNCVCCGMHCEASELLVHVTLHCPTFAQVRAHVAASLSCVPLVQSDVDALNCILFLAPTDGAFTNLVHFADQVECCVRRFWSTRDVPV